MVSRIIQSIKTRLKDPFWKNVATLFSGSAIAQALPIIVLPIITRIYTKEALGFYFVYAAIGLLTQIVASFQFQLAIVLPKSNKEANSLLVINFILVTLVSGIMILAIWIGFDLISSFIEQKNLLIWLYAIPLSTFFLGIFNAISYYFNRTKNYKTISFGKVSKSVTFSLVQIALGVIGYINSGLIIGLIIGQGVSMLFMFYFLIKKSEFTFNTKLADFKELLVRYKDIPFFNTLITFMNVLSNQLPLFLLTRYFGASAAGDFGLASRTILTPTGLISQSVGQVFYQEAADINNKKGNLKRLILETYKRLFKIGFIPMVIALITLPYIFKLFFGSDYESSARMGQILLPWIFLGFLSQPVSTIFTVLNKQRVMTVANIVILCLRFIGLYVGCVVFNNLILAVVFYTIAGIAFNSFQLIYFVKISDKNVSY